MNKYQKALSRINLNTPNSDKGWSQEDRDHLLTVIEALEKQIPKKPVGDLHSVPHYRCPNCQSGVVMFDEDKHFPCCQWCGQALDWKV